MGGTGFLGVLLAVFITTTSTQVLNCDFEKDFCQWSQVTTDRLDWSRGKGPTSTPGTGPSADHTSGGGYYAYLKSSNGVNGDTAELRSPAINIYDYGTCLQLYYHMYGDDVADLTVYIVKNNGTGSRNNMWSTHGNQGDKWNVANVHISTGSNFVIIIEAKRGAGYRGDIAIDDIRYLSSETCTVTLSTVTDGTEAATATSSPAATSLPTAIPVNTTTCDFEESNICTWLNDAGDDFDWTIWHGSTPSSNTGPTHDFTFGNSSGHYLYAEASSRQQGDTARLVSTLLPPSQHAACFNFMYSMYGEDIGTLNLYVRVGPVTTLMWTLSGDQGTDWLPGNFPLPSTSGTQHSQIIIESVIGQGYRGDIALDDLKFSTISCIVSPVMAGVGAATATSSPAASTLSTAIPVNTTTCDFEESNICTWLNDAGDDFDWIIWHGRTPSNNTGPTHDFTFGNSSGHYLYAEASSRQQGDTARLVSTLLPPSQHAACFNFMYSMYGEDIGTLNLYVRIGPVTTLVWTLSGDQGTDWLPGSFPLPSTSGTQHSQIIIESVIGKGYLGDIALDDLKFSTISCIGDSDLFDFCSFYYFYLYNKENTNKIQVQCLTLGSDCSLPGDLQFAVEYEMSSKENVPPEF